MAEKTPLQLALMIDALERRVAELERRIEALVAQLKAMPFA
jgi:hypothetical protein